MFELIKDSAHLFNMHTTDWQKVIFNEDCIIPDVLPDVLDISAIDVHTETIFISNTSEGTKINFNIIYKILYISDGKSSLEAEDSKDTKTFSYTAEHTITFADIFPENSRIIPMFGIESIESTIENSRKFSLKATLNVQLNSAYETEETICTDIADDSGDIQFCKESIPMVFFNDYITDSIEINEGIELSSTKAPFKEILRSDAKLQNITTSVENNSLVVKGNIEISTLYIADDIAESIQIIENEATFVHSLSVTDSENINWNTDLQLTDFNSCVVPDSDNENRILQISGSISVNAFSYSIQNSELLADAYSLTKNILLSKKSVTAFKSADKINTQFAIKESAIIDSNLPYMSQIMNVHANLSDYSFASDYEKINISGNLNAVLTYISSNKENPICSTTVRLPFFHTIENSFSDTNTKSFLNLNVNHISYSILSENELELRISLSVKGILAKECTFETITNYEEAEVSNNESEKPAILLYVVQTNDSLWEIAKRYNAPLEILKEVNHLSEASQIIPGQKILIPQ